MRKTPLEHFDDIREIEVADGPGITVEDLLPGKCEKVWKSLKALDLLMQELDCKDFAELRKYARCGYERLNKKYLKWEDLKFTKKAKEMLVKLGDTTYSMRYYKVNDHTNKVCISSFQFIEIYDIRFFNDLHLERAEE